MVQKSLYLINAGDDPKYVKGTGYGSGFPPLGVVSLGTVVAQNTNWSVTVSDGQLMSDLELTAQIKKNKPTVVGVSVLSTSYHSALKIAAAAKEAGSITIFGNDQAAITGRQMLRARSDIDYVCTADVGETALLEFLEFLDGKRQKDQVRNLMYRESGSILRNQFMDEGGGFTFLDRIPIPDRSLLPMRDRYAQAYRAQYPDEEATGTATINRFRGCARLKDPCTYCGIADLTIRASSPKTFWKDVAAAHDLGANRLFEAGDSVSSVPHYLEHLLAAKPKNLKWDAFVYTSARETTPHLAKLYQELGVFRANMGLDSGDDVMLQRLKGQRDSVSTTKAAVQLLNDAGIRIYASFVLGGPGESKESLENTIQFTRWLIDNKLVDGTEAQPLFPEINAKSGKMLLSYDLATQIAHQQGFSISDEELLRQMHEKWAYHENPDPEEISRDWATIFSQVPYDDLLDAAAQIREYSQKHGVLTGSSWIVRKN